MKPISTILFVGLFFGFTACTSANDPLPTVLTQATVSSVVTDTAAPPLLSTHTVEPTPEFTPLPTSGPSPTLLPEQATTTVEAILTEIATLQMTPPASTPDSTPPYPATTRAPGTWRIMFSGGFCPPGETSCDANEIEDDFFIDSDGSNLVPVDATNEFLANQYFRDIEFSSDASLIAYLSPSEIVMVNSDGSNPIPVTSLIEGDVISYDFWSQENCLAVYTSLTTMFDIAVQKICPNAQTEETIAVMTFPELSGVPNYRLSPRGEGLLAYGLDLNKGVRLYWQAFTDEQPTLLFHQEDMEETFIGAGPIHWLTDGQTIEFVVIGSPTMFYRVNRSGGQPTFYLALTDLAVLTGDWSSNGQQFVATGYDSVNEVDGLFIVDLASGEYQNILPDYIIFVVYTWKTAYN